MEPAYTLQGRTYPHDSIYQPDVTHMSMKDVTLVMAFRKISYFPRLIVFPLLLMQTIAIFYALRFLLLYSAQLRKALLPMELADFPGLLARIDILEKAQDTADATVVNLKTQLQSSHNALREFKDRVGERLMVKDRTIQDGRATIQRLTHENNDQHHLLSRLQSRTVHHVPGPQPSAGEILKLQNALNAANLQASMLQSDNHRLRDEIRMANTCANEVCAANETLRIELSAAQRQPASAHVDAGKDAQIQELEQNVNFMREKFLDTVKQQTELNGEKIQQKCHEDAAATISGFKNICHNLNSELAQEKEGRLLDRTAFEIECQRIITEAPAPSDIQGIRSQVESLSNQLGQEKESRLADRVASDQQLQAYVPKTQALSEIQGIRAQVESLSNQLDQEKEGRRADRIASDQQLQAHVPKTQALSEIQGIRAQVESLSNQLGQEKEGRRVDRLHFVQEHERSAADNKLLKDARDDLIDAAQKHKCDHINCEMAHKNIAQDLESTRNRLQAAEADRDYTISRSKDTEGRLEELNMGHQNMSATLQQSLERSDDLCRQFQQKDEECQSLQIQLQDQQLERTRSMAEKAVSKKKPLENQDNDKMQSALESYNLLNKKYRDTLRSRGRLEEEFNRLKAKLEAFDPQAHVPPTPTPQTPAAEQADDLMSDEADSDEEEGSTDDSMSDEEESDEKDGSTDDEDMADGEGDHHEAALRTRGRATGPRAGKPRATQNKATHSARQQPKPRHPGGVSKPKSKNSRKKLSETYLNAIHFSGLTNREIEEQKRKQRVRANALDRERDLAKIAKKAPKNTEMDDLVTRLLVEDK